MKLRHLVICVLVVVSAAAAGLTGGDTREVRTYRDQALRLEFGYPAFASIERGPSPLEVLEVQGEKDGKNLDLRISPHLYKAATLEDLHALVIATSSSEATITSVVISGADGFRVLEPATPQTVAEESYFLLREEGAVLWLRFPVTEEDNPTHWRTWFMDHIRFP